MHLMVNKSTSYNLNKNIYSIKNKMGENLERIFKESYFNFGITSKNLKI